MYITPSKLSLYKLNRWDTIGEKECLWKWVSHTVFWTLYNVCTKYLPVQIFYRCVYLCRTLYIVQKTFIIGLNEGSYCWCRHCYYCMLLYNMFCVGLLCWTWDINNYFTIKYELKSWSVKCIHFLQVHYQIFCGGKKEMTLYF